MQQWKGIYSYNFSNYLWYAIYEDCNYVFFLIGIPIEYETSIIILEEGIDHWIISNGL